MKKYFVAYITIIYLVGIAGHLLPTTREIMLFLTPFTLILNAGIVLFLTETENKTKFGLWVFLTFVFTYCIEMAGVQTGVIFGSYTYGEVLGIKVFDTPIIIGINWIMVSLGAIILAERVSSNTAIRAVTTGSVAVFFDIILEPCAIALGYWNWENGVIPFQNYMAWFAVAVGVYYLYHYLSIKILSSEALVYLAVQYIFFLVIRLTIV